MRLNFNALAVLVIQVMSINQHVKLDIEHVIFSNQVGVADGRSPYSQNNRKKPFSISFPQSNKNLHFYPYIIYRVSKKKGEVGSRLLLEASNGLCTTM